MSQDNSDKSLASSNTEEKDFDSGAGIGVNRVVFSDDVETVYTDSGDVLRITHSHRARAALLFDKLVADHGVLAENNRIVVSIGGPSGSGKSEIGALLSQAFRDSGVSSLLVPCDNYPIRFPKANDAHRRDVFDKGGEDALFDYLGSEDEIYFSRLAAIARDFNQGKASLNLRKINMESGEIVENLPVVVGDTRVLIFEGTWSCKIPGVTFPVYLDTNFKKTSDHRMNRNRTELADDSNRLFIEQYVLPAEQIKLDQVKMSQASLWLRFSENTGAQIIENQEAVESQSAVRA